MLPPRAWPLLLIMGAALSSGCANEVFETQVLVLADTEACMTLASGGLRVNAYGVVLFQLTRAPDPMDERLPCAACLEDGTCPVVQIQCRCGPPIPPTTASLNRALEGLRLPDLNPEGGYCLGLVAYAVPDLTPPEGDQTVDCPCEFGGAASRGNSRVCGFTPVPAQVGENESLVAIPAECRPAGCPGLEL